jgi:hypothetical protein
MPLHHLRKLFLILLENFRAHISVARDVDPFAESARRFTNEHCVPPEVPDGIPPEEEPINQVWDMRDDFLNIQVPRDSNPTSNIPSHATTVEDPYQGPNSPTEDTHVVCVEFA